MTIAAQMVEAAKDVLFKRGIVDTFTVREALTAALALAKKEGAVLCVVPGEVFVPQWDDDDKHEPWFQVGETYGRAKGHNQAIAASPEVVRGLVEALDAMQAAVKSLPPSAVLRLSDDLVTRFLRADGRATAMLKAAKEAGL